MFIYFLRKIKKIFGVIHNTEEETGGITNKNMPQLYNESPPAAREKGDPQAGQRGRLFAAGLSVAACFTCFARLETAV